MIEPSRKATLEPRMVTTSTQLRPCAAQPGVSGAPRSTPASQGGRTTVSTRSEPHDADRGLRVMAAVEAEEQRRQVIQERCDGEAAGIDRAKVRHAADEIGHGALRRLVVSAQQHVSLEPACDRA